MKFIGNIFFAFLLTFFLWTGIKELAQSDTAIRLTHWVYRIPFWWQVFFFWIVFTFPKTFGDLMSLIANAVSKAAHFTITNLGQLLEATWKYRAGKFAIGGTAAYLAYIFIF